MKKSILPFVIIGAVFVVSIGVSVWLFNQGPKTDSGNTNGVNGPGKLNPDNLPKGAEPPRSEGTAGAKVVLEEFGDFQCPPCGAFHPDAKQIVREFGDRIQFIFRNNPLRIHQHAYDAARAAEAAGIQGKYWEMHDKIYDNQATWSTSPDPRNEFDNYARLLGLNVEQFRGDRVGEMVNSRVAADMRRATAMGVTGTPTVFLNGRKLEFEDTNAARLRILINEELKK